MKNQLVYDIGMFDGSDTKYYLEEGATVVAVEANPAFVKQAERLFASEIASGQLTVVSAAISTDTSDVTLHLCSEDLGSSSIMEEKAASDARDFSKTVTVPGITMESLIDRFGSPFFVKVDIEGADSICVKGLSASTRPPYLSFELGSDAEELIEYAREIGYTKFKLINQCNFLEFHNQRRLSYRLAMLMMRNAGYGQPTVRMHGGRAFKLSHSAGPAPWVSDGRWTDMNTTLAAWRTTRSNGSTAWYDLHATAV